MERRLRQLAGTLLIAIASAVAYWPALHGGFILDDDIFVTSSALVQSPNGLARMWLTFEAVDYWPVTNSSFWFEWRLWGMNPTGYHVTNLILHIACCLLLWAVLQRLGIPGAWLAAVLFAIHPVNVESVAWISQRKNLLSLLFSLLAVMAYLQPDRRRWYWVSLGCFLLAILSKGSVATLPLILLLIVWWQRGQITRTDLIEVSPFLAVSATFTLVNLWFQATKGIAGPGRNAGILERFLEAGATIWFYLSKALLPIDLAFIYPQWDIRTSDWRWWMPLCAAIATTAIFWAQRRTRVGRALWFAWLFFCFALLPVMGFVDVSYMLHSLVADHYMHLALIGVVAPLAAGIAIVCRSGIGRGVVVPVTVAACAAMLLLSRQQSGLYTDALTLYQDSIDKNPDSWLAHNNLGNVLLEQDRISEALDRFEQVIRLNPGYAEAHCNRAEALVKAGRGQEAAAEFAEAIRLRPDYVLAHCGLGMLLAAEGKRSEAAAHFKYAVNIRPIAAKGFYLKGIGLYHLGQPEAALEHFRQAIRMQPKYADALVNLGNVLLERGQTAEAIENYERALSIQPNLAAARWNLASALCDQQRFQDAVAAYREFLELRPDFAQGHYVLGNVLLKLSKPQEAIDEYRRAIQLKPDFADAQFALAGALAQIGRLDDAKQGYERAIQIDPLNAAAHVELAALLAKAGQFQEAAQVASRALDLAKQQGKNVLSKEIQIRLNFYRSKVDSDGR